jgi:hypothetical protein
VSFSRCPPRCPSPGVLQGCPSGVSSKDPPRLFPGVSSKVISWGVLQGVLQECPPRCPPGVSSRSVLWECPPGVSSGSVPRECPPREFFRVVLQGVLRECALGCPPRCPPVVLQGVLVFCLGPLSHNITQRFRASQKVGKIGYLIFKRCKELLCLRGDWASWMCLYLPRWLYADFFSLWSMKKELPSFRLV